MNYRFITLTFLFALIFIVACGGSETSSRSSTESNGSNESTTLTSISPDAAEGNYSYTVSIGEYVELSPDNAIVVVDKLPGVAVTDHRPGFVVENKASTFLPPHFNLELRDGEVVVGEHEIARMNVSFDTMIDGAEVAVGCGGNSGTPEDVFATITAVNGDTFSGSLTVTLTSCNDFYTAENVASIESVTVTAEFTDVPYLPEEDAE